MKNAEKITAKYSISCSALDKSFWEIAYCIFHKFVSQCGRSKNRKFSPLRNSSFNIIY
jgi:hypothetical protein